MTTSEANRGPSRGGSWRSISLSGSAGLIALVLLAGAVVARARPELLSALWTCTIKDLTGLPCLTCGLTRVLLHFAGGELVAAFTLAPLPALLLVLALCAGAWQLFARARGTTLPDEALGRWLQKSAVRWGVLVCVLALWLYAIARSLSVGAP